MAADPTDKKLPYRWHAFTHWLNLAFLAGAGIAGAVFDPIIWMLAAPLELGALWVLPDLPNFRSQVDQSQESKDLRLERAYCMEELWGLAPVRKTRAEEILGWIAEVDHDDLDARVLRPDATFQQYKEMRQIIAKIVELEKVRGVSIVSHEMGRFQQVINGFLRYLMACRSLSDALRGIDSARLNKEVAEIHEQIQKATPDIRPVLLERRRLRETQLERLPKLQATLELFRTRADAIVYQMRNIHGQVLADPGANVNTFLEDIMEKQELMTDPLGELEADQAVRELLNTSGSKDDNRRRSVLAIQSGKNLRQG